MQRKQLKKLESYTSNLLSTLVYHWSDSKTVEFHNNCLWEFVIARFHCLSRRPPYFHGVITRTMYGRVVNALWQQAPPDTPRGPEFLREAQAKWNADYKDKPENVAKLLEETRPFGNRFSLKIRLPAKSEKKWCTVWFLIPQWSWGPMQGKHSGAQI